MGDKIFGKPISTKERSRIMSRIRSSGTKLEESIFEELKKRKYRFRKHYAIIGRPDVAWPSKKVALFIDSDYWHGWKFDGWKQKLKPFWRNKIHKNIKRDIVQRRTLRKKGWKVVRVWENDLKRDYDDAMRRLIARLDRNLNNPKGVRTRG